MTASTAATSSWLFLTREFSLSWAQKSSSPRARASSLRTLGQSSAGARPSSSRVTSPSACSNRSLISPDCLKTPFSCLSSSAPSLRPIRKRLLLKKGCICSGLALTDRGGRPRPAHVVQPEGAVGVVDTRRGERQRAYPGRLGSRRDRDRDGPRGSIAHDRHLGGAGRGGDRL